MKKIGVLYGKERSFPMAFIEAVNSKNMRGVHAESVLIDKVIQGHPSGYSVIIDRISQDVPFYRAFLKNAAISGTAVKLSETLLMSTYPLLFMKTVRYRNPPRSLSVGIV